MQEAIQFDATVESGIIRIPERYVKTIPTTVKVTLAPANEPKIKKGARAGAGELLPSDFSAMKINTKGWKFNREEANER
jgi:hypothetical protein